MLKRTKRNVSTPGELDFVIQDRMRRLHFASFNEYVNSLILYDCWAEKPHALTGPIFAHRRDELPAVLAEIVRDYGKKSKTGSFFEHHLQEIIRERVAEERKRK